MPASCRATVPTNWAVSNETPAVSATRNTKPNRAYVLVGSPAALLVAEVQRRFGNAPRLADHLAAGSEAKYDVLAGGTGVVVQAGRGAHAESRHSAGGQQRGGAAV